MEKKLQLFKYNPSTGASATFPNTLKALDIYSFTYSASRMSSAPTIEAKIKYPTCLDSKWTYNVYVVFNGEKYFLKNIPSSSYSNEESVYTHDAIFISERVKLEKVFVYDVVDALYDDFKPVSNSTKFTFYGDVSQLCSRLNQSLKYRDVDYNIVIDEGITSEEKLVSVDNTYFLNVLQEVYNTYNIPFYFKGKEIHIGYSDNTIPNVFKYGVDESLLSIRKENANNKIITNITGIGSGDNIPYYYPNDDEKGEVDILYNGEKGRCYIEDKYNFHKAYLNDVFEYVKSADSFVALPMSDWTLFNYFIDKDVYHLIDGSFRRTFSLDDSEEYSLIWNMSKTLYNAAKSDIKMFRLDIYKDGLLWKTYGGYDNLSGTSILPIGNNNYKIECFISIDYTEISYKDQSSTWEDEFTYMFESRMSMKVGYGVDGIDSWKRNGDYIKDLHEYGIGIYDEYMTMITNGDKITLEQISRIQPQPNLMPPSYRENYDIFYPAKNDTYKKEDDSFYVFDNEYNSGNPHEHILELSDIKPTIVGMTNSKDERIDEIVEFAYDIDDNDEVYTDGEHVGKFKHPYFFAKLRKFDGKYGFNLFDSAIDEAEMTLSLTTGNCGACEFTIMVSEKEQKNLVQVDENGNLLRDKNGDVRCGRDDKPEEYAQERQNDTSKNEVWIALKKEESTFGVIMPNATNKYRPSNGDRFVILHIELPKAYIIAAEDKLKNEIIKYMSKNNKDKFNFSISFSRIYLEQNQDILNMLNENARIQVEYDGNIYILYVSSFSYSMENDSPLPKIDVELSDQLSVYKNAVEQGISAVETSILNEVNNIDFLALGLKYFLRKDVSDETRNFISFLAGLSSTSIDTQSIKSNGFSQGKLGSGFAIYIKDGKSYMEVDEIMVRMKAMFTSLEISELRYSGGEYAFSPAGMKCYAVSEYGNYYRCYLVSDDGDKRITNKFMVNDLVRCTQFDINKGSYQNVSNRNYWRLCIKVGTENDSSSTYYGYAYIDLSKTDCLEGSDIPQANDNLVTIGNKSNISRQSVIVLSSYGEQSPSITLYEGINTYDLANKDSIVISPKGSKFKGSLYLQDGTSIMDFVDNEISTKVSDYELFFEQANNLLSNAMFVDDLRYWSPTDMTPLTSSEAILFIGNSLLLDSESKISIEKDGNNKAIRLLNSGIRQDGRNFKDHIGGEYYIRIQYKCIQSGSLTFTLGPNSIYIPISVSEDYTQVTRKLSWSGEGDFSVKCDGECLIQYCLVSTIQDVEHNMESIIYQTANRITLSVTKDNVVSAINMSPDGVTIDAKKINLNGVVTANNNFKINEDGSAEMRNAKLSGNIYTPYTIINEENIDEYTEVVPLAEGSSTNVRTFKPQIAGLNLQINYWNDPSPESSPAFDLLEAYQVEKYVGCEVNILAFVGVSDGNIPLIKYSSNDNLYYTSGIKVETNTSYKLKLVDIRHFKLEHYKYAWLLLQKDTLVTE